MTVRRIELEGTIALDDVSHVRRFVEALHRRVAMTHDDASRLAMVTHELLENAIKFSTDGGASLRVEVAAANRVCITTRNRTRERDLDALKAITSTLVARDPMDVYIGLMKRAPAAPGGLGLGRVAAEGEMEIGLALDGDIVQVQARTTLAPPPA